jgi:hypothetical protein
MNRYNFSYNDAAPCWYNGCYFHSRLELKFALMIEDHYYYIREPVVIPYDRHKLILPKSPRSPVNFYVPDFMIRSKRKGDAYLIEIKPESYDANRGLTDRTRLVRQFIRRQKLDWKYRLVTEKDIELNDQMQEKYRSILTNTIDKLYVRSFQTMVPDNNGTNLSKGEFISMVFGISRMTLFP